MSIGAYSLTMKVHLIRLFGKIEVCDGISGMKLARLYYSPKVATWPNADGRF